MNPDWNGRKQTVALVEVDRSYPVFPGENVPKNERKYESFSIFCSVFSCGSQW